MVSSGGWSEASFAIRSNHLCPILQDDCGAIGRVEAKQAIVFLRRLRQKNHIAVDQAARDVRRRVAMMGAEPIRIWTPGMQQRAALPGLASDGLHRSAATCTN